MCLPFPLCIYKMLLKILSLHRVIFSVALGYFFLLPKIHEVKVPCSKSNSAITKIILNEYKGTNNCIYLLLPKKFSDFFFQLLEVLSQKLQ